MMRKVVSAAITVALAASLVVGGAIVLRPGGEGPAARGSTPLPEAAALLAHQGGLEAQIAALQERLREVPGDWRGFAALGIAYVAQARTTGDPSLYPKAEGVLATSIRLHAEDNEDGLLGLGALALARHDFDGALRFGRRASEADQFGADAYGVIGDALLELGRYGEAFDAFQTMVDTRPDLASYARASYARELQGDVRGAVRAMTLAFDAAATPGDAAWAAYQLGELAFGSGDVSGAASWYRRGLELDPAFVPNLAGTAKVAWSRGDDRLAIERYREVTARYPSPEFVVALADLYRVTGRDDLADEQEAVVRALHELADGNGVNADLELAVFDADHGEERGALVAARAEWSRRRSVHVADALAWALYANGRYGPAATFADRALRLGTENATFLFHAGMIRLALGDQEEARALLRRAVAVNPNFSILHADTAERVLARLGDA
ncbi:MAG TPA: tetratricopeptide repeat protein [Actinomycetota bacterium]|jgi:tetratricopeptide (TPR) repeat protein|nr:tetratricopeptide repeat protein [Actinomycetota bacterium]